MNMVVYGNYTVIHTYSALRPITLPNHGHPCKHDWDRKEHDIPSGEQPHSNGKWP